MKQLTEQDAITIHEIIMDKGTEEFKNEYTETLKVHAAIRNEEEDMAMCASWAGVEIPSSVQKELQEYFDPSYLDDCNLLAADESLIELNILATELPDNIVMEYFDPDFDLDGDDEDDDYENDFYSFGPN